MTAAMFSGVISASWTSFQRALSQSSAWLLQPTMVTSFVRPAKDPEILRQENAALRVRLAARGEGEERAHPALLYERHRVHLIGKALPALGAVRRKARSIESVT